MSSETKFLIKILSGLHTGAEYHLPPGVTRLGSSAQCDLVLHDKGIAEELYTFTCTGAEVEVSFPAQDTPVLLDGVEQSGPVTIPEFGLLTSSALYLAVGAADKPWKIPSPEQLFVRPGEQASPAAELVEEQEVQETYGPEDNDEEEDTDEGEADEGRADDEAEHAMEETVPAPETSAVIGTQPSRRVRIAAGAVLVLSAIGAGLYWYKDDPQPASAQPAQRITRNQIETIAERYGLDATFELNKGNILTLEGYARNAEDERKFVRAMYDRGIIVRANLVITEQFRNNIQNILEQYVDPSLNEQVNTSIAEDDITTLILRGYVQDADKWRSVLAETVGEVDSINYIDEVSHWSDSYAYLQELVARHGLHDSIHLEEDRQHDRILLYSPYLDEAGKSSLELLMEEYRGFYAHPEIRFEPELGKSLAPPEFMVSSLVGASFNARPYLLFDDGQRYFVGSVTPDGYRVEEINEEFAVLSRDAERYNYSFADPGE